MLTFSLRLFNRLVHSSYDGHEGFDNTDWPLLLAFISPAILYFFYWLGTRKADNEWKQSVVTSSAPLNKSNLFLAYVGLAARFIQADQEDAGKKVLYVNAHFKKYFPQQSEEFSEQLRHAYRHPVQVKTVGLWLRRKLSYDQRVQVLYFLMGLTFVDGSMNGGEYALLQEMVELLEITPKDYQSVLGVYQQRYQRAEDPKKYTSQTAIKLSCEILGVSENASLDEIKKAYRQMAKLHHPDRFATEGPEQQRIAQERFQEIQRAYEILEKRG